MSDRNGWGFERDEHGYILRERSGFYSELLESVLHQRDDQYLGKKCNKKL